MARYLSFPKETLEEAGLNISALNKSSSVPISSCELCMTDDLEPDDIVFLETCNHAFCKGNIQLSARLVANYYFIHVVRLLSLIRNAQNP